MKNLFTSLLFLGFSSQMIAQSSLEINPPSTQAIINQSSTTNDYTINVKYLADFGGFYAFGTHKVTAVIIAGGTLQTSTVASPSTNLVIRVATPATLGSVVKVTITAERWSGGAVVAGTSISSPETTVITVSVLPIELTSFTVIAESNKVNLAWTTASEKDNASFNVERSNDGVNFTTVGTVKGHGTSNEVNNYTFTDATATGSVAYYRLKDTDFAGQSHNSNVVSVKLGKGSKLEVGVIATDLGLVTYNSMEEGNATLQVVNLSGQVVAQAQATATEGNNVVPMNLNALANGIYMLQVRTANSTVTKKFVKN
jgi:hypothetical protein